MKKTLIITALCLCCFFVSAQDKLFDNYSLRLSGAYISDKTFSPEIALQTASHWLNKPIEVTFGLNYRQFNAEYQEWKDLEATGGGIFAEATIFPFEKYFYTGLRWELITINKLSNNALQKINSSYSSNMFSGTNFYGIIGLDVPLAKVINVRLYAMAGARQYKISDGSFSSGSYSNGNDVQDENVDFVYQINLGFVFRLK